MARCAAAAVDAAVLLAVNAALVFLIAWTCGVTLEALLRQAWPAVSMLCWVPVGLYFILFRGVGGRTPGAFLCHVPQRSCTAPLGLRAILLRAFV